MTFQFCNALSATQIMYCSNCHNKQIFLWPFMIYNYHKHPRYTIQHMIDKSMIHLMPYTVNYILLGVICICAYQSRFQENLWSTKRRMKLKWRFVYKCVFACNRILLLQIFIDALSALQNEHDFHLAHYRTQKMYVKMLVL